MFCPCPPCLFNRSLFTYLGLFGRSLFICKGTYFGVLRALRAHVNQRRILREALLWIWGGWVRIHIRLFYKSLVTYLGLFSRSLFICKGTNSHMLMPHAVHTCYCLIQIQTLWHERCTCSSCTNAHYWYEWTVLIHSQWRWCHAQCIRAIVSHKFKHSAAHAARAQRVLMRITDRNPQDLSTYGVATISRLLKMIGLFCKRALKKRRYSAKETYNFKEPTNRSHPIHWHGCTCCARSSCTNAHY